MTQSTERAILLQVAYSAWQTLQILFLHSAQISRSYFLLSWCGSGELIYLSSFWDLNKIFSLSFHLNWPMIGDAVSSMHSICNFPVMLSNQSGWLKQPTLSTAPISILLISLHQWVKNTITSRFHNLDFKHYKVFMQETFLVLSCKCKLWACRLVFGCRLLVVSIKEDLPPRIISTN